MTTSFKFLNRNPVVVCLLIAATAVTPHEYLVVIIAVAVVGLAFDAHDDDDDAITHVLFDDCRATYAPNINHHHHHHEEISLCVRSPASPFRTQTALLCKPPPPDMH